MMTHSIDPHVVHLMLSCILVSVAPPVLYKEKQLATVSSLNSEKEQQLKLFTIYACSIEDLELFTLG